MGLDGDSSDGCLICVAIGHQLLELQSPASDEAERWTDGSRAVDWTLPQRAEWMRIVKGDAALLEVQTHTQPWRKRIGDAGRRRGAVGVRDVPVVDRPVVGIGRGGQVDLPHAHCEEGERGQTVWRVFYPTVMAAVRVIPGQLKTQLRVQSIWNEVVKCGWGLLRTWGKGPFGTSLLSFWFCFVHISFFYKVSMQRFNLSQGDRQRYLHAYMQCECVP